jgi:hypothetical protein
MGLFRNLMNWHKDRNEGKNPNLLFKAIYAMTSGGLGAFVSNPADLAMVRF